VLFFFPDYKNSYTEECLMGKTLVEMAADIIQSQCGSTTMTTEEIGLSLQNTFKTLQDLQSLEIQASQEGITDTVAKTKSGIVLSPEKSLQKNKVVCLECGQEFKMLSPKHLKSHGLTSREYRVKHGFSLRQPLCAKSLSDKRKKAGKARGLPDNLRKAIAQRKKRKTKSAAKKK
jgi:predicted transcriptional regulator